jgi:hypothetical protein
LPWTLFALVLLGCRPGGESIREPQPQPEETPEEEDVMAWFPARTEHRTPRPIRKTPFVCLIILQLRLDIATIYRPEGARGIRNGRAGCPKPSTLSKLIERSLAVPNVPDVPKQIEAFKWLGIGDLHVNAPVIAEVVGWHP